MNTMTAVQANNLRVLADHIDGLKRWLNMGAIQVCGTPACAIGEAACMPHFKALGLGLALDVHLTMRGYATTEHTAARELFGISSKESCRLFGYRELNCWNSNDVPAREWAAEARRILAAHGYPAVVPGELACVDYCPKPVCTCTDPAHPTAESVEFLQRLTAPVRVRG